MRGTAAPTVTANGTRIYRSTDWGGWVVLTLLASLFIGTGITIRAALEPAHPTAGGLAVVIGGLIALAWAAIFYSFRVSTHAAVTQEGITVVHGPWRHHIAWRDVERVAEWSEVNDGIRYQWLALWSIDGTRLQVREDLPGEFSMFRNDVLSQIAEPHPIPDMVTDLAHPLAMRSDRSPALSLWSIGMAIGLIGGGLMFRYLPEILLINIGILVGGALCLLNTLRLLIIRQDVMIGGEGLQVREGFNRTKITWAAMYGMERDPGKGLRGVVGILTRGLVMILFRIDRRSVVVPGEARTHGIITIRGNSGEHIRIQEIHFRHPEWLRARLRAEVEAMRQTASPVAAHISPLPPTGKLRQDITLPPDFMETSTLWMRESGETDLLRDEIGR